MARRCRAPPPLGRWRQKWLVARLGRAGHDGGVIAALPPAAAGPRPVGVPGPVGPESPAGGRAPERRAPRVRSGCALRSPCDLSSSRSRFPPFVAAARRPSSRIPWRPFPVGSRHLPAWMFLPSSILRKLRPSRSTVARPGGGSRCAHWIFARSRSSRTVRCARRGEDAANVPSREPDRVGVGWARLSLAARKRAGGDSDGDARRRAKQDRVALLLDPPAGEA